MASDFERCIISPRSGAKVEKTSGPVGECEALQLPNETSLASGAKSSAAPAAIAAAFASLKTESISLSSILVRVTPPEAIDPPTATNAMTVTLRS